MAKQHALLPPRFALILRDSVLLAQDQAALPALNPGKSGTEGVVSYLIKGSTVFPSYSSHSGLWEEVIFRYYREVQYRPILSSQFSN